MTGSTPKGCDVWKNNYNYEKLKKKKNWFGVTFKTQSENRESKKI